MAANWRADKAPEIGLLISGNAGKSRLTPKILTLLMRKTTRTPDPAYRLRFKGGETFCSKKRRVSQDALESTDRNRLVGPVRGGFFRDEGIDARTDQGDLAQERQTSGGLENDGVPGQVRTANLPLRRGMLYPIELLRHKSTTRNAVRWTACMLTVSLAFVMSSMAF